MIADSLFLFSPRLVVRLATASPATPRLELLLRRVEEVAGDHELLDLRGALVDLRDLRVPEIPLDLVLLDEAVATVHLDGVGRDPHRRLRGEELGHRRRGPERRARVLEPRRPPREEARGFDRGR